MAEVEVVVMSDIAEFLTARLDESQAIAQDALDTAIAGHEPPRTPGRWHVAGEDAGHPSSFELHFEPEAILVDIAAKRAIVAEYDARHTDAELMLGPNILRQREWSGLRLAVSLLASAHADHPDYKEEWKP